MVKKFIEINKKSELEEITKNNLKKILKYNLRPSIKNVKIFIWILISISFPLFKFSIIKELGLKFIIEKDKYIDNCTKDDIYKYEYNKTCYISCPKDTHISLNNKYLCEKNGNIFNKEYRYNSFNYLKYNYKQNIQRILDDNNDDEVDNIRNKIKNGEIYSIINDTNREYIYMTNNIIFQVTSLDYLYNNKNTITSLVKLGECEKKIRMYYNISEATKLIIFKIDYYTENSLVPIVEYEIYYKNNKISLNICNDMAIEIYTPVSLDINKTICITLCDDNCEFLNYDLINKMYGCKCKVKNKINLISEIEIQEWNSIEYFNKHCPITDNIDDIINKIRNELKDADLDSLIPDVITGNDIIIKKENVTFQITTSENQANNKNNNISNIDLGECEYLLRNYYNIKEDEQLLIFKSERSKEGALVPTIEYEVYDINKNKLNLSICKDVKIDIEIPVLIDEYDLVKYNSSSEYYKDSCYTYTTQNGTDITLEDRKKEFVNNNISLCEDNCQFEGYDSETKKIKCQCQTKSEVSFVSEIYDIKDKLLEDFNDMKEKTNIFKCVKLLFSKEGLKSNIGSYTILVIMGLNIVLIFIFSLNGTSFTQNEINKALKTSNLISDTNNGDNKYNSDMNYNNNYNMNNNFNMNNNNTDNKNNYNNVSINNNNMINYNNNDMSNNNMINYNNNSNMNNNDNNVNANDDNNKYKENTINIDQNNNSKINRKKKRQLNISINNNNIQKNNNPPPKKVKAKKKKVNTQNSEIKENIDLNDKSDSKAEIKNIDNSTIKEKKKNIIISLFNNINVNKNLRFMNKFLNIQKYNEYELNNLNYYEAISIDKRTYFEYYYSLVKRKNIFIFAFIISNDYNIKVMKISLFFLSFCIFYLINSIYITDSTIHQIYIEEGRFNFVYQLPQIIYAILISAVLISIMKFMFLSEKNILEIKRVREQEQLKGKMNKIIGYIKCKTYIYFLIDFILKFFCWFYVGLFGAVFKNTQIYLIKKTVISFGFYLLYPFIYSLLPGVFRLSSLNAPNKNRACLYKFSRIIQINN